MFYFDKRLQYPVRVERPNPLFAKMLQQALGGVEGEMRVMFQYLFQAWNSRGPAKYRDLLLNTGTEEIGHVEMLATAIALNLQGSPSAVQEEAARANPMVAAVMGGMSPRQYLSGGMGALAADSEGNPFNGSWVVSSGNIAADMYSNVNAEASGLVLATRLYEYTDDPGMKDMLRFLISRDVMHQQQWLAVIEELGGPEGNLPIPNSFPHDEAHETREFAYTFFTTSVDGSAPPQGRWTSGPSLDGRGEFRTVALQPMGEEPQLAPPLPQAHAQLQEIEGGQQRAAAAGLTDPGDTSSQGIASRLTETISSVADDLLGRGEKDR
ncbi:manganese catalase family protein [Deinococcus aquaedulcis]|uniref:manganese catalase family protein n=1 Tax=Deinococcus aquaedulcis TaxID=2840455 RepID=UPI001C82C60F|nr:manganese catalase family protein [Deinococcus aquaedulcis]